MIKTANVIDANSRENSEQRAKSKELRLAVNELELMSNNLKQSMQERVEAEHLQRVVTLAAFSTGVTFEQWRDRAYQEARVSSFKGPLHQYCMATKIRLGADKVADVLSSIRSNAREYQDFILKAFKEDSQAPAILSSQSGAIFFANELAGVQGSSVCMLAEDAFQKNVLFSSRLPDGHEDDFRLAEIGDYAALGKAVLYARTSQSG